MTKKILGIYINMNKKSAHIYFNLGYIAIKKGSIILPFLYYLLLIISPVIAST